MGARGYTCGGIGLCVPTAATLSTFKGNAVVQGRAAAFATATVEA